METIQNVKLNCFVVVAGDQQMNWRGLVNNGAQDVHLAPEQGQAVVNPTRGGKHRKELNYSNHFDWL